MTAPTGYNLIWFDDFTGTTIDTSKWNVYTECHPAFTPCCAKSSNVIVDGNSLLHLKTVKNASNVTCPSCHTNVGTPGNYPWTSAFISTKGRFTFTYGFIEMRAKMPKQQGQSGGLWMTRADESQLYKEMDIPEWRGLEKNKPAETNKFYYNNLWFVPTNTTCPPGTSMGAQYPNRCGNGVNFVADFNPALDFHLYQFEWTPTFLKVYIDGVQKGNAITVGIPQIAFGLILSWDTGIFDVPDNTTLSPSEMIVDYIKIYQLNATPVLGSISLSPTTPIITAGNTTQINATCKSIENNDMICPALTWSSSNNNIATVNSSGLVTGITAGTTNITCSSDSINSTVSVTIKARPVLSENNITPILIFGGIIGLTLIMIVILQKKPQPATTEYYINP